MQDASTTQSAILEIAVIFENITAYFKSKNSVTPKKLKAAQKGICC